MLTEAAFRWGLDASQSLGREAQRDLGQFMTPQPIADFMAREAVKSLALHTVRLLEPAAGTGVLVSAAVHALLDGGHRPKRIEVLAYEIDARLMPALMQTCASLQSLASSHGVDLHLSLRNEDFLLSPPALAGDAVVDLVIANPPYFKLPASDPRSRAHAYAVHGQPNIYGLFMAACARLLRPGGQYCFITPRSWTNGPYFAAVRKTLFARLSLQAMHLFSSRKDHFSKDDVLQEAMVLWASDCATGFVDISDSAGAGDLGLRRPSAVPIGAVVTQRDLVVQLGAATDGATSPRWPETLGSLGLSVSTGPTVAFRARDSIEDAPSAGSVPLLWMQHVRRAGVSWPLGRKGERIRVGPSTSWMLVHNEPLVLLRRFSPKEELRRVTATAYLGHLPGRFLGLENHLNYIYRRGGSLSATEAVGLAAVLNSAQVERHLRAFSGNTQINATDLRTLPLPGWKQIVAIGASVPAGCEDLALIDRLVNRGLETEPLAEAV